MLTIKTKSFKNTIVKFNDAITKAEKRASKRLAQTIINEFVKEIRKDYAVKSSALKENIKIIQGQETRIVAKGKQGIPLIQFPHTQTKKGVSFIVSYQKGRRLLPHAFIATMKSGHKGIFIRETIKRLPIKEKFGPDLRLMLINPKMMRLYNYIIKTKYKDYYNRELKFYLQREFRI